MKKYLYTLCTAALLGLATSCVDSFDATNQNPNKLYLDEIDIQKIFPGTIYKSLDVLSEMNYNYYAYMARYVVSWTSPQSSDNVGDRFYNFYKKVLGDVAIMEQNLSLWILPAKRLTETYITTTAKPKHICKYSAGWTRQWKLSTRTERKC